MPSSEMWYLMPNDKGETTVEVIGNIHDNKSKELDTRTVSQILDELVENMG